MVVWPVLIHSQGCSDAGFCTVHSIKPIEVSDSSSVVKNLINTGFSIGVAQYSVLIVSPYVEYSRIFNKRFTTTLKLLYSVHGGDLTTNHGLSDIILTTNYKVSSFINLIGGFKIPLNSANSTLYGLSLPMSYQTSLGTFDAIAGISYKKKSFSFTFAYQQPLTQNENKFFVEDYPPGTIDSNYQSTNNYFRKADLLLRMSYNHKIKNKRMALIYSVLPIYHIGDDTFVDKENIRQEIEGSRGLTLNLNIFYKYKLSDSQAIELSLGAPVVSRDSRPDGLSSFSLGIEYSVNF